MLRASCGPNGLHWPTASPYYRTALHDRQQRSHSWSLDVNRKGLLSEPISWTLLKLDFTKADFTKAQLKLGKLLAQARLLQPAQYPSYLLFSILLNMLISLYFLIFLYSCPQYPFSDNNASFPANGQSPTLTSRHCYQFYMQQQPNPILSKQRQLRRLVRSLSSVSNVETTEIRKDIKKAASSKNRDRISHHLQKDQLLKKHNPKARLPQVLFTHRLFEDRGNKIASLKEKKIESEAYLKTVNFQYRKLQIRKQQIAKKQHLSTDSRKNHPAALYSTDLKNLHVSQIFQKVAVAQDKQSQKQVIKKVKTALNSSRSRVKALYSEHCQSLKALTGRRNESNPEIELELSPDSYPLVLSQIDQMANGFAKTHSIIVKPGETSRKKQSLIDLIELSRVRTNFKEQTLAQKLTNKEIVEQKAAQALITSLKSDIDRQNRLRESIVLGGLKKLLYGDRRGRFIQDNTFKTRLKGENSQEYLNILKRQQQILTHFDGSIINRRNLAEKFSNILGKLNKGEKHVHEKKFGY